MAVAYGRVTREQRYTADDPCPGCGGYDSRKLGHARCWGVLTSNGQGFICTVASSGHPARNGDGWVHLYVGCDCGVDHIEQYHPAPLQRRSPDAPAKVTTHWRKKVSDLGQPEYTHVYSNNLRLLRWGTGEQKTFFWIHFDRDAGWVDGMGGYTAGFYRTDEIAAADARKPVYLAGGEKCVDELVKVGAVAGCNPHGENGQLSAEWVELLRGRHVVILADADEKGRTHAQKIADALTGVAASVRVLELEGAHDVADWFADGHTLLELLELIAVTPVRDREINLEFHDSTSERLKAENATLLTQVRSVNEKLLWIYDVLAVPQERMNHSEKCLLIAARRNAEWSVNAPQDGESDKSKEMRAKGYTPTYLESLGRETGMSSGTVGKNLKTLKHMGAIVIEPFPETTTVKTTDRTTGEITEEVIPITRLAYTSGPTIQQPHVWMPEGGPRKNRGGARDNAGRPAKVCKTPGCGSEEFTPERTYRTLRSVVTRESLCKKCGKPHVEVLADDIVGREQIADGEDREINLEFHDSTAEGGDIAKRECKDTPPPPDSLEPKVEGHATQDELRCPNCGRGGDMLKDYGDGIVRCRACDVPVRGRAVS